MEKKQFYSISTYVIKQVWQVCVQLADTEKEEKSVMSWGFIKNKSPFIISRTQK